MFLEEPYHSILAQEIDRNVPRSANRRNTKALIVAVLQGESSPHGREEMNWDSKARAMIAKVLGISILGSNIVQFGLTGISGISGFE